MAFASREIATPLDAQPAGDSHQQVMSPTQGPGKRTTGVGATVDQTMAVPDIGPSATGGAPGRPTQDVATHPVSTEGVVSDPSGVEQSSQNVEECGAPALSVDEGSLAKQGLQVTRQGGECDPLACEPAGGNPGLEAEPGVQQAAVAGHSGDARPGSRKSGTLEVESRGVWSAQGLPSMSGVAGSFSAPSQLVSKVGRLMQDVFPTLSRSMEHGRAMNHADGEPPLAGGLPATSYMQHALSQGFGETTGVAFADKGLRTLNPRKLSGLGGFSSQCVQPSCASVPPPGRGGPADGSIVHSGVQCESPRKGATCVGQ